MLLARQVSPVILPKVYDNEDEDEQFLWGSYSIATWKSFGGWNQFGCIPQHYILPKYKDIIADCAEVMPIAKEGSMLTSATHLTLLKPLSESAIQERRQWPKYGGAIPTPWAVHCGGYKGCP